MAEREYERLARARRRRGRFIEALTTYTSLWLARDHLLCINTSLYIEQYKRFYFRDIQAFTTRKTRNRAYLNFVWGLLLLLMLAAVIGDSDIDLTEKILLLLLPGLPLLLNNALGSTCTVYIRTAVQTEELSCLCRIRRVSRVLDRIRPMIATAQAHIEQKEAAARIIQPAEFSPTADAEEPAPGPLDAS